jgi:hypothetical protein
LAEQLGQFSRLEGVDYDEEPQHVVAASYVRLGLSPPDFPDKL